MSTFVYCTEKLFCIILFGSNSFTMLTFEKVVQAAIVHLQWRIQEFEHLGWGPDTVEFLGLGFLLMPLPTCFCSKSSE